jgi:hypothetical protein
VKHTPANPLFGKKSSGITVTEAGETSKESRIINRDDFWASTSKCERSGIAAQTRACGISKS